VHHTYRAVARRTQEAPPPRREASGPVHVLTGIISGLAEKINEIVDACGSKVISAVRHTYVAGTRTISLHASGRAVDVAGNPGCIYEHLKGWPGGYSIDYAAVQHVHISLGGREDGCRFVHGGGHHAHRRRHRHRSR
jgi:hypothetical protein